MGGLFGGDSGPSAGDIQRAEEAAFKKETERLRIQEQNLRQRESEEITQGQGVATTGAITLGDDAVQTVKGGDKLKSIARGDEPDLKTQTQTEVEKLIAQWTRTGGTGLGGFLGGGGGII